MSATSAFFRLTTWRCVELRVRVCALCTTSSPNVQLLVYKENQKDCCTVNNKLCTYWYILTNFHYQMGVKICQMTI